MFAIWTYNTKYTIELQTATLQRPSPERIQVLLLKSLIALRWWHHYNWEVVWYHIEITNAVWLLHILREKKEHIWRTLRHSDRRSPSERLLCILLIKMMMFFCSLDTTVKIEVRREKLFFWENVQNMSRSELLWLRSSINPLREKPRQGSDRGSSSHMTENSQHNKLRSSFPVFTILKDTTQSLIT